LSTGGWGEPEARTLEQTAAAVDNEAKEAAEVEQ